jgi:hypothetical protein
MVETIEESRMSGTGEREDALGEKTVEDAEIDTTVEDTEVEEGEEAEEATEEAEEGSAEEGAEEAPAAAAKPRSAATIAVQEAKRAAKEAKAEAEATRRELEQLKQERQGRQTAEQQELERQHIALMDPEEKTAFLLNKQQQEFNGRFGALEFRMQDAADRTAFEASCARNPAFDAVRDDVERQLAEMRRTGANANRETVALYFIGKRAVERAAKGGKAKQAAKGEKRIQSERVAAPSGRSDVRAGGEKSGAKNSLRARLENQQI